MKISLKEIEAVSKLPGPERYRYFIKKVVDCEKVWGLYKSGWALAASDDGSQVFPMWPAQEYASICAKDEWEGYEPAEFSLDDLKEELLPKLKSAGILPGIFYTIHDTGVIPELNQLENDLSEEEEKY